MLYKKRLEEQASINFELKDFKNALFLYSQLSSQEPDNQKYKLYALLCDLASEDEEKAMSLYDYFSIEQNATSENTALDKIYSIIKDYDGSIDKMLDLLGNINAQNFESLDAIDYNDFKELVQNRGSFKQAFEDIMFSTKVAIENKDDFFDFVNKLIDNNFNNTAYSYLDGFYEYFSYDKRQEELYKKLEEKNIERKH